MTPLAFLATGAVLGLGAGLSPGPLTALVCTETLRHGAPAGLRVSITPMLTDSPLLLISAVLAARLPPLAEAGIALAGAAFLAYLAWDTARTAGIPLDPDAPEGSLRKAVLTNLLNPHPYVFWASVGGPLVAEAWSVGAVPHFLVGFFFCIVGSKAAMALLIGRYRGLLAGVAYRRTMQLLAVGLALLALRFAESGLSSLLAMG